MPNFVRYASLLALLGLAAFSFMSMPEEARAVGTDAGKRRYVFGSTGLTRNQTLRVSVVRPALEKPAPSPTSLLDRPVAPVPELPDKVQVIFYDASGAALMRDDHNMPPNGKTHLFELPREAMAGGAGSGYGWLQVRAEVIITPNLKHGRFLSPIDIVTMEVVDSTNGKTAVVHTNPASL